jgi:hypothetical protein
MARMPDQTRLLGPALGLLALATLATPAGALVAVTAAGDFQSEVGCTGDWQADCAATHMTYDANGDVFVRSLALPPGTWKFKVVINDSWSVNYGQHGDLNGQELELTLAGPSVKFYWEPHSHLPAVRPGTTIAVAAGAFQSELGCSGDWQPECLRSWLLDLDGDGVFRRAFRNLPAGDYFFKIAIDESWNESYGAGGQAAGADIPFSLPQGDLQLTFAYDGSTHVPTFGVSLFSDGFDFGELRWTAVGLAP